MNRNFYIPSGSFGSCVLVAWALAAAALAGCGDKESGSATAAPNSGVEPGAAGASSPGGAPASAGRTGSAAAGAGSPAAGAGSAAAGAGSAQGGHASGGESTADAGAADRGGSPSSSGSSGASGASTGGAAGWAGIAPGASWQWQLTGTIDTSLNVAVYDIDLFDADAATVSALHAKGAQVICYVSVGSYEDWRPDAADFPAAVLGKDYPDWPGEKFLDIRALDTLGPIMQKRLDLCRSKGFDGLEPDNMDVFEGGMQGTGFPLTRADGIAYIEWLTAQAHARGLSIGQKNTSELADQLATEMDWALTEDCFDQNWCADMSAYVSHGKAVLMSEYTDTNVVFGDACTWAKAHQYSAILKGRDLDAPVQFCP